MSVRRIGIGRLWHESNTFSSALTTVRDFETYQGGTLVGADVLRPTARRDEVAGFVRVLSSRSDVEVVPLFSAGAMPSGRITWAAAKLLESTLRDQLDAAGRLDGICFAPHGAMTAEGIADFDGYLLEILRSRVGPDAPMVTALDCHAVVTKGMLHESTAIVGYRTHPHIDRVETGARAARLLLRTLDGEVEPVMRARRAPLIFPPPDDGTTAGALEVLFETAIGRCGQSRVLDCSLYPSFAWQDVPEQGVAAIAVTDGDPSLAQELADELALRTWRARHEFAPEPMVSVAEAMHRAGAIDGSPVVITDSADTVGGGAPGDNNVLLSQVLEHRHLVDGLILAHLPDAPALRELATAKAGDTVSVAVGGKRDTRFCRPLPVTGLVERTAEGPISDDFGAGTTPMLETGRIICLAIDNVRLVLTERVVHGPQPSLFRKLSIEPFEAKVVTLKTGVGFKQAYARVAKAVLRADCPGAESYDLTNYEFTEVPRPIYPLDPDFDWQPSD